MDLGYRSCDCNSANTGRGPIIPGANLSFNVVAERRLGKQANTDAGSIAVGGDGMRAVRFSGPRRCDRLCARGSAAAGRTTRPAAAARAAGATRSRGSRRSRRSGGARGSGCSSSTCSTRGTASTSRAGGSGRTGTGGAGCAAHTEGTAASGRRIPAAAAAQRGDEQGDAGQRDQPPQAVHRGFIFVGHDDAPCNRGKRTTTGRINNTAADRELGTDVTVLVTIFPGRDGPSHPADDRQDTVRPARRSRIRLRHS